MIDYIKKNGQGTRFTSVVTDTFCNNERAIPLKHKFAKMMSDNFANIIHRGQPMLIEIEDEKFHN